MTDAPPAEKKPRSKRMVVWMIAVPIVILLLALAGANWKTFHLACAKHLMRSPDPDKQERGAWMVAKTHLRDGMPLEEVRRLLAPARVTEILRGRGPRPDGVRVFDVFAGEGPPMPVAMLFFDKNGKLTALELSLGSWSP